MIYKNKERVGSICEEIDRHMDQLNDLCGANDVKMNDTHGHYIFTIVVRPDSQDEYVTAAMILINFIKDDLKRKIADLHIDLEKL